MPKPGTIIILFAFSIIKAASSGAPERAVWVSAAVPEFCTPKEPVKMFSNDRFIAFIIIAANINPPEPTIEPMMIKRLSDKDKPMPTAAQPEQPLSSDTATGMSAPPTGRSNNNPRINISKDRIRNKGMFGCRIKITDKVRMVSAKAAFNPYWPVKRSGCAGMNPCNLAKATREPEKVMPPTNRLIVLLKFCGEKANTSLKATQAAANPPRPFKAATICGRAVILILKAV